SAPAFARWIGKVTARAGVHRADQNKVGREGKGHVAACQRDGGFFQRLAQHLKNVAGKLRQLVEKQNSVVRQADLAGARCSGTTANEPRIRHGVVRRAKWTASQ